MKSSFAPLALALAALPSLADPPRPDEVISPATCDAQAKAAAMDSRTPVPLIPMMAHHQREQMRGHLESVQAVLQGLSANDFVATEKAARSMGFTEQMGMMCEHMGAGAPGFSEQALKFHHSADKVADAAHRKDRAGVLKALDVTLQACTACHASYRQQVVDQATYDAAAAAAGNKSGPP